MVVEECLRGREVSLFVFADADTVSAPVTACDYKRQLDGDKGPNTGGMGCYSPAEFLNEAQSWELRDRVAVPVIKAMAEMGCPYKGVLYVGVMMTEDGPKVLEFNVRLGDPEAQVVLPRLESDLVEYRQCGGARPAVGGGCEVERGCGDGGGAGLGGVSGQIPDGVGYLGAGFSGRRNPSLPCRNIL